MTVTLKDPLGNRVVTRTKPANTLKRIDVGSKCAVLYSEGHIVSLSRNP
jgi:hypothetical protein